MVSSIHLSRLKWNAAGHITTSVAGHRPLSQQDHVFEHNESPPTANR